MATLQEMQAQAMEPAMIGSQSQQPVKRQQTGGTVAPPPIGHRAMSPVGGSAYPTTDASLYGSMQQQAQNYQVPEGYEPMQQATMTSAMASNPAYLDMQRNAQLQMLQQQQQQKMDRDRARQLQQQQRATAGAISPLGGAIAGSASPSVMQNALPLLQAMQSRGYAENPRYQRAQRERQLQMQRQMAGIGNYGGGGQIGQDTSNMDMNALLEMLRSMGLIQ